MGRLSQAPRGHAHTPLPSAASTGGSDGDLGRKAIKLYCPAQAVAAHAGATREVVLLGSPGWEMSVVKAGSAPTRHTQQAAYNTK